MLIFIRLNLVQLHCADASFLWEQLSQLVEGYNILVFRKALSFISFFLFQIFSMFISTWANSLNACANTLVIYRTVESSN